jgi:hypothetical protein
MSEDSTDASFTIQEFRKDDPRLKQLLELYAEEPQSAFVATIQLLPGSDVLEIEDMDGSLAWQSSNLSREDFCALEELGLRGKLVASGCTCLGDEPFESRTLIVATTNKRASRSPTTE